MERFDALRERFNLPRDIFAAALIVAAVEALEPEERACWPLILAPEFACGACGRG